MSQYAEMEADSGLFVSKHTMSSSSTNGDRFYDELSKGGNCEDNDDASQTSLSSML